MNWKINIENRKNQRIQIKYDPIENKLIFIGEYKNNNPIWIEFHVEKYSIDNELDKLNFVDIINNIVDKLNEKVDNLMLLNEQLSKLSVIEIKEDDE